MVVVIVLAVFYPPVRWVALGGLLSMVYGLLLHGRLLENELSLVSVLLGALTTLVVWLIVSNLQ
jgi:hypothetical protein